MTHCLKCWLFLCVICGSAAPLFGAFPIEAILFDQDGSGPLSNTGVIILDSSTMSATDVENAQTLNPEIPGGGAIVVWIQNGRDIKAITFDQRGSGPLTTSGIISLGTATGTITAFQSSGGLPEEPGGGAVVAWVEDGTNIKAIIFDQSGSGPLTTTGIISLGTAGGTVTSFKLPSYTLPEDPSNGTVAAWVEDGTAIKAITFNQHGSGPLTTSGIISLGTATGNITAFQLSGSFPEYPTSGAVIAWVEDGTNIKAIMFDQDGLGPLTTTGTISLGTTTGNITAFQLSSGYPESSGYGSVVAWVEDETNIKAILFDQYGAGPLTTTGIISLGTAGEAMTSFQLSSYSFPEKPHDGAVAAWVEDGTNIKAIIFNQHGSGPLTTTGIISLGTAAAPVSSFRICGAFPEVSGSGAAVAWVENGTFIKAITFDQSGSGPLTTTGIISLGRATSGPVTSFQIAGVHPEGDTGAVVTWIVAPQKSRPFLRPSNRR